MRKKLITTLALVLSLFVFAGCSGSGGSSEDRSESRSTSSTESSSKNKVTEKSKTEATDDKNNEDETNDKDKSDKSAPTEKANEEPLECDWTMQVDQTIPITVEGITVNYNLVLVAQKNGGKDVLGDYKGSLYLSITADTSSLSNEVLTYTGGVDVNLVTDSLELQLVPYNVENYTDYGAATDELPLAPLVQYEAMALVSPMVQGSGILNPTVVGVQGEKAEVNQSISEAVPLPMKITVIGGQVSVELPSLKAGKAFDGMLLGTPVNSKESNKKYEEMMKKIDELEEQLRE